MKTFVRVVIVLVVFNLVTGDFAVAKKTPKEKDQKEGKKILEAEISKAKAEAERQKEAYNRELDKDRLAIYKNQAERYSQMAGRVQHKRTSKYGRAGTVLVIPTAETTAEDIATIMEDMSVMSRILDKKLSQSHTVSGHFYGSFGFSRGFPFSWGSHGTEGIYLDGYGALFFIKVDFPLAPVPEAVEEEIEEEAADLVWEQARQEIFEPMDVRRGRDYLRREEEQEYDAEKVKELKDKLIKALKHAANIQNLKPNEWIILTVVGETEQTGEVIVSRIYTVIKGDDITADLPLPLPIEAGFSSPTVLIIRVKKSDAEAFSKGELDFDQFRQRVQIFTY